MRCTFTKSEERGQKDREPEGGTEKERAEASWINTAKKGEVEEVEGL